MSAAPVHPGIAAASTALGHAGDYLKSQTAAAVFEHPVFSSTTRAHSGVAVATQKSIPVKGTLKGGSSTVLAGNLVLIGGLSGNIGKVQFHATANGVVSGNRFLDGSMHFTNSKGTITASLGHSTLVTTGNSAQLKNVLFIFQHATGIYTPAEGWAGDVTFKFFYNKSTSVTKAASRGQRFAAFTVWATIDLSSDDPYVRILFLLK